MVDDSQTAFAQYPPYGFDIDMMKVCETCWICQRSSIAKRALLIKYGEHFGRGAIFWQNGRVTVEFPNARIVALKGLALLQGLDKGRSNENAIRSCGDCFAGSCHTSFDSTYSN